MAVAIFDLEDIVDKRAWEHYLQSRERSFPRLKRKVNMVIDWSGVKFIPDEPVFEGNVDNSKESCIFESVFENNSNINQQHSLKVERQTTSSCTVTIKRGYTTGFNLGLKLAAPSSIASAAVGFSKGFSVENAIQTVDQKTLTWSSEGVLTVEKNSKMIADIMLEERKCDYEFKTRVNAKGTVKVDFYKRGNNTKYLMKWTSDMRTLLRDKRIDPKCYVEDEDRTRYLILVGSCDFKYGIEMKTVTKTEELKPDKKSKKETIEETVTQVREFKQ